MNSPTTCRAATRPNSFCVIISDPSNTPGNRSSTSSVSSIVVASKRRIDTLLLCAACTNARIVDTKCVIV